MIRIVCQWQSRPLDVMSRTTRTAGRAVMPQHWVLSRVDLWGDGGRSFSLAMARNFARDVRPLMGADTFVVPPMVGIHALDQSAAGSGRELVVGHLAVMLGRTVAPAHVHNALAGTSIVPCELVS